MANKVEITVRARDDGSFRRVHDRINRMAGQLRRTVNITVNVRGTAAANLERLDRLASRLSRTVTTRVRIQVTPQRIIDTLDRALGRIRGTVTTRVRIQVTPAGALRDLREDLDRLSRMVTARIRLRVTPPDALDDLRDTLVRLREDISVIRIRIDIDSIEAVRRLREELERIERRIRVRIDVDSSGGGGAGLAGLLGSLRLLPSLTGAAAPALAGLAANVAAVGAAAIAAAPLVGKTVTAVADVAKAGMQAAPALAAFAVAGGVVAGTLKAIFAEGRAMREVLQPLADGLKLAGDNASRAAASGLKPLVAEFKKAAWPEVNHTMVQIGNSVNRVAKGFLDWAKSSEGVRAINGILHPIWQAVDNLEGPVTRLAISFANMLSRIMGVSMAAGSSGLAGIFERLAQKMDAVNADTVSAGFARLRSTFDTVRNAISTVVDWVQRAVDAYMRFRTELGLVGTALSIVAIAFGGPVTAIVGAISLVVMNFDRLKAAYTAVVTYFQSSPWGASFMSNMRDAAGTVIPAVVGAFRRFRTEVEPAVRAVGQFIATQLIPAVGKLAADAAPKIAAFAMALSNAASTVVPHVIAMFEQLRAKVGPVIQDIANRVVNDLIPTLTRFVEAAAPVVAWFVGTFGPVIVATVTNVANIIKGIVNIIIGIFKVLTAVLTGDWQMLWNGIVSILQGVVGIIGALVNQLWSVIKMAFQAGWAVIVAGVQAGASRIIALFESIGAGAVAAVKRLVSSIVDFFKSLYNTLVGGSIVPDIVNGIIRWFSQLASSAPAIISALVSAVVNLFRQMMTGAVNAISSGVSAVTSAISAVKNAILGAFAGAGSWLVAAGRNVISGFVSGIRSMAGAVASAVSSVVARARNMLPFSPAKEGPLSGRGAPDIAGAKLIQMVADGIRSQAPYLAQAMSGALGLAGLAAPGGGRAGLAAGAVAAGRGGGPVVLELRSSGSRVDDLLLEVLRRAIRVRGGDVQTVLGTG